MTLGVMGHFVRDLYQKLPEDSSLKSETGNLIEKISILTELYDYLFSDIFRYKDGKIEIDEALITYDINEALKEIKECYNLFNEVLKKWKSERN